MIPTKQKKGKSSRLREERERNKKLFLPKAKDNKDIKLECTCHQNEDTTASYANITQESPKVSIDTKSDMIHNKKMQKRFRRTLSQMRQDARNLDDLRNWANKKSYKCDEELKNTDIIEHMGSPVFNKS